MIPNTSPCQDTIPFQYFLDALKHLLLCFILGPFVSFQVKHLLDQFVPHMLSPSHIRCFFLSRFWAFVGANSWARRFRFVIFVHRGGNIITRQMWGQDIARGWKHTQPPLRVKRRNFHFPNFLWVQMRQHACLDDSDIFENCFVLFKFSFEICSKEAEALEVI